MQLMEQVREIRADEHVDDAQINAARQALLREITRAESKPALRTRAERKPALRRRAGWIGAGGLVAASAAGAIVAGSVLTPAAAPLAAAAVFEEAAEVVVTGEAFSVPPGSYLRVTSSGEWFALWDMDMPDETSRFNNGNPADAEAAVQLRGTTELYVPSDRSEDWVLASEPTELVGSYGADEGQAVADFTALNGRRFGGAPSKIVAPGGAYTAPGASGETDRTYYLDSRESWEDQPTDPHELLAWLRTSLGEEDPNSTASDSSIVETLTGSLGNGAAPPERRAAWLRVLALLEGSSVESVEGDVTTIRFSWSTEWWDAWTVIDIDTARGVVLSVTQSPAITGDDATIDGLPEWASRQTYSYEVIDSAPSN